MSVAFGHDFGCSAQQRLDDLCRDQEVDYDTWILEPWTEREITTTEARRRLGILLERDRLEQEREGNE